jgi:hypothetical protein
MQAQFTRGSSRKNMLLNRIIGKYWQCSCPLLNATLFQVSPNSRDPLINFRKSIWCSNEQRRSFTKIIWRVACTCWWIERINMPNYCSNAFRVIDRILIGISYPSQPRWNRADLPLWFSESWYHWLIRKDIRSFEQVRNHCLASNIPPFDRGATITESI